MRVTGRTALAALLLVTTVPGLALLPTPVAAQESSDTYDDLVATMRSNLDHSEAFEFVLDATREEFRQIPDFEGLEAKSPGLLDELTAVMRPFLAAEMVRKDAIYRAEIAALFRANLTIAEANELAAFYASPVGQRLMLNVSRSYRPENSLPVQFDDEQVLESQVTQDVTRAASEGFYALSSEDQTTINRMLVDSAGFRKFFTLRQQTFAIQTRVEGLPALPEDEAELERAIEAVFEKRFPE